ncbi:hypothetical protein BO443_30129 [Burkholderia orbicola]
MSVEWDDDCAYDMVGAASSAMAVVATAVMVTMSDFTISSDSFVCGSAHWGRSNRWSKFRNPERPDKRRFLASCVPECVGVRNAHAVAISYRRSLRRCLLH